MEQFDISALGAVVDTFAMLAEYRSMGYMAHITRIKAFTRILVDHLSTLPEYKDALEGRRGDIIVSASVLHDVGKITISDRILLKPGRLTKDEFEVIKTHPAKGAHIIKSLDKNGSEYYKYAHDICRFHHEQWNGKGYPDGLSGTDIPLCARIVMIVDVYDALTGARCYKPEFSSEESLDIIKNASGTHFEPRLVEALIDVRSQFERVACDIKD